MQKCWDVDPSKRPTIYELYKFADNKLKEIYENENSDNNDDIGDTSINNDGGISNKSQQIYKSHPLAYHTSRILDDDITKSKELYYNSKNNSLNDLDINSIILNIDLNKGKLKID